MPEKVTESSLAASAESDLWLLVGDWPCISCGHNLRTQMGPVVTCPECGAEVDLRIVRPRPRLPRFHKSPQLAGTAFLSCLMVACTVGVGALYPKYWLLALLIGLFLLVLALKDEVSWINGCRDRTWGRRMLVASYTGVSLSLVGYVWSYWAVGQILMMISRTPPSSYLHFLAFPCLAIGTGLCYWIHRQMDPAGPNSSRLGIHGWQQYPPVAGGSSLFVNR